MADISRLGGSQNLNTSKVEKKISFSKGDKFEGKIISQDSKGNAVIKLNDGWQFDAEILGDISSKLDGNLDFEVVGYSGGKLKLKVVENANQGTTETPKTLEDLVSNKDLSLSKEDIPLLKMMLKYNMSLSKENIANIKSMLNFAGKIQDNPQEINDFILKFLASKGISPESEQGKTVTTLLNNFLDQFKNMSAEDMTLFLTTGIEFDELNIKSLQELKDTGSIQNTLVNLKESIFEGDAVIDEFSNNIPKEDIDKMKELMSTISKELGSNEVQNIPAKDINMGQKDLEIKNMLKMFNVADSPENVKAATEYMDIKEIIKEAGIDSIVEKFINSKADLPKEIQAEVKQQLENICKNYSNTPIEEMISLMNSGESDEFLQLDTQRGKMLNDGLKTFLLKEFGLSGALDEAAKNVKNDNKLASNMDIKTLIRTLMSEDVNASKVVATFKEYCNTVKLYNNLSKNYYMLDLPVNINQKNHNCKLLIKDDRGKGKKIDTRNVSLVATVDTVNMGEVDAVIKVLDKKINIRIKTDEEFIGDFKKNIDILSLTLNKIGYISNITVDRKIEKITISNVAEYLEQDYKKGLNARV